MRQTTRKHDQGDTHDLHDNFFGVKTGSVQLALLHTPLIDAIFGTPISDVEN